MEDFMIDDNEQARVLSGHATDEEFNEDKSLRPDSFKEYIGQSKVVDNVEVMIESSNIRKTAMDHVLLAGPPGLGKTTLATIMANKLGTNLHVISGPALEKKGDLAAILSNLGPRDVLFIDEIHRIHISIEEILYSAMEDYRLDIIIGQGPAAKTMQIKLNPFTLIGATTRSGLLSRPLRDRFQAHLTFDYYSVSELQKIIQNNAKKMSIELSPESLEIIASRSRGTPRVCNRILRRVRDYALISKAEIINEEIAIKALDLLDIDSLGLDKMDRKILEVINDYYSGGPVGIEAICATLADDKTTIEDVYEPYLLKSGLLLRTPRGRALSDRAKKHLSE